MLNILVATRTWAEEWSHRTIEVHCDNLAVVSVLCSGRTKNSALATISRNPFMTAAKYDIFVKVSHISGQKNALADLLSRWQNSPKNVQKLQSLLPCHTWVEVEPSAFHLDENI